ncbi:hypothetical protein L7F22_041534 [Adiantum nelumboides]|nr:hypothetical protein [Adiantum nelumboides]
MSNPGKKHWEAVKGLMKYLNGTKDLGVCFGATSTFEAEYVAASEASKEAIWLACLVSDLGIFAETPTLHCDSQSVVMLPKNPVFHAKTKHISMKYHFIQDVLEDKHMQLVKVHIDDNPADLLTKSLPLEQFTQCRALMGVR